jgi:glycosyltransferase involved in cell wall biosynthesis
MSVSPAVALVVAVHQRPRILELVLRSLENQTWTDFEVVLADDGSDDAVRDVVRAWTDASATRSGTCGRRIEDSGRP